MVAKGELTMNHLRGSVLTLAACLVAVAPALAEPSAHVATAKLSGVDGSALTGTVTFTEGEEGVTIVADVENAPPGRHGFHLHAKGDCSAADFTSTGGHFNPTEVEHGAPDAAVHHAGDFGNLTVGEDGKGHLELTSSMLTVADGPDTVVGRGLILHAGEDDLTTQPTGAAGARIGCGVVEAESASSGY